MKFKQRMFEKLDDLFGMDTRALAFMRIVFSFLILTDFFNHSFYLTAFYTDQGILPRRYALGLINSNAFCLHLIGGSWFFEAFLFLLSGVFAFGLLIGYKTRLCTFMTWILLVSVHNRNILLLGAEDKFLHILFFWFLFLPWGECYSVDSYLQKNKVFPIRVSSMATVGYLLQVSFFYIFAGFLKTHPQWTTEGSGAYYVLNCEEFIKPFGTHLLQFPLLLKYLSFFALWLERWGAFFFFIPFWTNPIRLIALFAFAFFHIGILVSMELSLFQWICLITLIGFLPTTLLNRILKPFASRKEIPEESSGKSVLFHMPFYLSITLASFILYIFFWNMGELENSLYRVPRNMQWIGSLLNLNQHWGMFAPRPMTDNGWYVMPGRLRDGSVVDVFKKNETAPVVWDQPASIVKHNNSYHWTLYYLNIRHRNFALYRKPLMQYICREWNSKHQYEKQLMAFDFIFMDKETLPDYQKSVPKKTVLSSYYCFKQKHLSYPVFKD